MALYKCFLMFLFVAIMATSVAEAQTVHLNGTLYCSINGSRGSNRRIPAFHNATIMVACMANVLANSPVTITNNRGVYLSALVPQPQATIDSIIGNCRIFVRTPLSNCNSDLPPVGLISNLQFVRTVPVGSGTVSYLTAGGFALQG